MKKEVAIDVQEVEGFDSDEKEILLQSEYDSLVEEFERGEITLEEFEYGVDELFTGEDEETLSGTRFRSSDNNNSSVGRAGEFLRFIGVVSMIGVSGLVLFSTLLVLLFGLVFIPAVTYGLLSGLLGDVSIIAGVMLSLMYVVWLWDFGGERVFARGHT